MTPSSFRRRLGIRRPMGIRRRLRIRRPMGIRRRLGIGPVAMAATLWGLGEEGVEGLEQLQEHVEAGQEQTAAAEELGYHDVHAGWGERGGGLPWGAWEGAWGDFVGSV